MGFILGNMVPIGAPGIRAIRGTGEDVRGAPQLFAYRTQDTAEAVQQSGYFRDARSFIVAGDIILRVTIDGAGVPQSAGWHVVMVSEITGTVDVADPTTLSFGGPAYLNMEDGFALLTEDGFGLLLE